MNTPAHLPEHPLPVEGYFKVDVVKGIRAMFLALLMAAETIL